MIGHLIAFATVLPCGFVGGCGWVLGGCVYVPCVCVVFLGGRRGSVWQATNVLVIGLTNRPELLDDALLRPGRLEVKLEVSLPDEAGRREILRIHTRAMRANGALAEDAECYIDVDGAACSLEAGAAASVSSLAAATEHFSGAELAGLVRSAASFALGRAAVDGTEAMVRRSDLEAALREVRPAKGRQDEAMVRQFATHGVDFGAHAPARRRLRSLLRSCAAPSSSARCAVLIPESRAASEDAVRLAAWAGSQGGSAALDFVRQVSLGELVGGGGGASEEARCAALAEHFAEARSMRRSMLVLTDIDLLLAAQGGGGRSRGGDGIGDPSAVLLGTLRSLLRTPLDAAPSPPASQTHANERATAGDEAGGMAPALVVLATVSEPAAAEALCDVFEPIPVPLLRTVDEAANVLRQSPALSGTLQLVDDAAALALSGGPISAAALLRHAERACVDAADETLYGAAGTTDPASAQLELLRERLAGWR